MNTTRELPFDDDGGIELLDERSEREDELIAVVREWHVARHCTNPDARQLANTEADLLDTCRWYFEHGN